VLRAVGNARVAFPTASALGAGLANGALPCGLVYAAGLAAATTDGPLEGATVMLAFGAGTVPMVLGVWTSASRLPVAVRQRLRVLTPAALGIVGVMLLLRGVAQVAQQHVH
jgi:sulfite exporter TauE/SafE